MREENVCNVKPWEAITRSQHLETRRARSGKVNVEWQAYGVVLRRPCLEIVESGDEDLMPLGCIH